MTEPVQTLSVSRLFQRMEYQPHAVQRRIHAASASTRFRVVCAGRRTGKSTLGGHELSIEAFKARTRMSELSPHGRRAEFWIVGPEYSDAEKEFRVLYNDLSKMGMPFDKPGTYNSPLDGNMHISLWGGRFQVHAKSAKYPDTLVGEALEGVILAEAAKLKPKIWTKHIRPMLADYRGWGLMTSTPEGKNWFYDMYQRGQSSTPEDANWWSVRMPSWTNNILFPLGREDPEIRDMGKDMSDEKFQQEIGAEFTEFVGRVFKDYDDEDVPGNFSYNPAWPLYIATDYGFTNPNVFLFIQVDVWDNVVVLAEYYKNNETTAEAMDSIERDPFLNDLRKKAVALYPDPEDPAASNEIANRWRVPIKGKTGGLLSTRIDLIRRWLKPWPEELEAGHPDKKPRLRFNRKRTPNLMREMQDYHYPENKNEMSNDRENPVKKDDHTPEALGRFFAGHYGAPQEAERKARVRAGQLARR